MSESSRASSDWQRRQNRLAGRALAGLTVVLAVALVLLFVLMQQALPWLSRASAGDGDETPGGGATAAPVDVTGAGATTAQRALETTVGIGVPELTDHGWKTAKASAGVPSLAFGFGCEPKDGLAAVVSASRAWVNGSANRGSVEVSAMAYPAGGGAVAFLDAGTAVDGCSGATRYPVAGLGVEAMQVTSAAVNAVVWRRGDVLMLAKVTTAGRAGSLNTIRGAASRFDDALDAALTGVCVDQNADATHGVRSPYVNRNDFKGRVAKETVLWDAPADYVPEPDEEQGEDSVDAPEVPVVGDLPEAPSPMVTDGPTALPEPVAEPTAPVAPTASPKEHLRVAHTVADPDGPGCGWAFTGQGAPKYDADGAEEAYVSAVEVAQRKMTRVWKAWKRAKEAYDLAYVRYLDDVDDYTVYADDVAQVREVWDVVNAARAEYQAALDDFNEAKKVLADWKADRKKAQTTYAKDVAVCETTPETEAESTEPASPPVSPTTAVQPKRNKPVVCPPVRPAILDETAPNVPESPVPAPEAQLPSAP